MLKIAHIRGEEEQEAKPDTLKELKKKLSDPAFFNRMMRQVIDEHNQKIEKKANQR